MKTMPNIVTHNFDPEAPFLANLCDLPDAEAEAVLQRIRDSGRRSIKADYLPRRRQTETWLIGQRIRLLGMTPRERPVYFFLGNFADGLDPSRPRSLLLPLAALPPEVITFTYPDSMASLPLATRDDLAAERQPYHGRVFTLADIRMVIEELGMPENEPTADGRRRVDRFMEVQVWDERPILDFLASAANDDQIEGRERA